MKRWLSQTRTIAARISSRMGRYCAWRSSSGTLTSAAWPMVMETESLSNDDSRSAPKCRVAVGILRHVGRRAGAGIEHEVHVFPGKLGQIEHHRLPAAIARVA